MRKEEIEHLAAKWAGVKGEAVSVSLHQHLEKPKTQYPIIYSQNNNLLPAFSFGPISIHPNTFTTNTAYLKTCLVLVKQHPETNPRET